MEKITDPQKIDELSRFARGRKWRFRIFYFFRLFLIIYWLFIIFALFLFELTYFAFIPLFVIPSVYLFYRLVDVLVERKKVKAFENSRGYIYKYSLVNLLKPFILKGDILKFIRFKPDNDQVFEGDIVVFKKLNSLVVKKIYKVFDDGLFVQGNHPKDAFDSRTYGLVRLEEVKYLVKEVIDVRQGLDGEYSFFNKTDEFKVYS